MRNYSTQLIEYFQLQANRIRWAFILFFLQLLIYGLIGNYSNTAHFGGDTWEYQSMAVNLIKGHGFPVFGGKEPIETYKFDDANQELIENFMDNAGNYNFYRTPAYPVLIAGVYSIVGINPGLIKYLQLVLLLGSSISLAWLGMMLWSIPGFVAGLFAGVFLNVFNVYSAKFILTEPLITSSLTLSVFIYLYYRKNLSARWAILLGLSLGFSLLVKGVLIFVPFLIGLWEIYYCFKYKSVKRFGLLVLISLFTLLTIAPWSYHMSRAMGKFMFLSTQSKYILLDNNNEYCLDGKWHPEWTTDANSFYQNDGLEEASTLKRVANFYLSNLELILPIFSAKLRGAFYPMGFLWIFITVCILLYLDDKHLERFNPRYTTIYRIATSLLLLLIFSGVFYSHNNSLLYYVYDFLLVVFIMFLVWNKGLPKTIKIPDIFWIVFLNFFIVSLIASVDDYASLRSRFVRGMEFIFNLTACYYLLLYFLRNSNHPCIQKQ